MLSNNIITSSASVSTNVTENADKLSVTLFLFLSINTEPFIVFSIADLRAISNI